MNNGKFEQIGTPDEIYNHPKTSYVATFVGNSNILKGTAESSKENIVNIKVSGGTVPVFNDGPTVIGGESVTLAVRSENIHLDETGTKGIPAEVVEKSFAGGMLRVVLKLQDDTEIIASRYGIDAGVQPGQKVSCSFAAEDAVLVDREVPNA